MSSLLILLTLSALELSLGAPTPAKIINPSEDRVFVANVMRMMYPHVPKGKFLTITVYIPDCKDKCEEVVNTMRVKTTINDGKYKPSVTPVSHSAAQVPAPGGVVRMEFDKVLKGKFLTIRVTVPDCKDKCEEIVETAQLSTSIINGKYKKNG